MREIKFRAWHNTAQTMLFVGDSFGTKHNLSCCKYLMEGQDVILMQYTGLTDRNGREIYEGDILRICNESINLTNWMEKDRVVKFQKGCFNVPTWDMDSTHWFEVIGNIYENPELLNQNA